MSLFFALLEHLILQFTLQYLARTALGQCVQDDEFFWHLKWGEVFLKERFDLLWFQGLIFSFKHNTGSDPFTVLLIRKTDNRTLSHLNLL